MMSLLGLFMFVSIFHLLSDHCWSPPCSAVLCLHQFQVLPKHLQVMSDAQNICLPWVRMVRTSQRYPTDMKRPQLYVPTRNHTRYHSAMQELGFELHKQGRAVHSGTTVQLCVRSNQSGPLITTSSTCTTTEPTSINQQPITSTTASPTVWVEMRLSQDPWLDSCLKLQTAWNRKRIMNLRPVETALRVDMCISASATWRHCSLITNQC